MAVRAQRISSPDAALQSAPPLAACGQVKNDSGGLNITIPTTLAAGNAVSSEIIDVSGYRDFLIIARASVANAISLAIAYIDPIDGTTVLTELATGAVTAGAGTYTPMIFGSGVATTNVPLYLIRLKFINVLGVPANITALSSLMCRA